VSTETTLDLEVSRPFSVVPLLAYLRARAIDGVESVGVSSYRRSLRCGGGGGVLTVSFREADRLGSVTICCSAAAELTAESLRETVSALIDADAPVEEVQALLEANPSIGTLARLHRGLRIPGTVEPFELAVRAILGQQISVAAATTLAGRIAREWGSELAESEPGIARTFPGPEELAEAPLEAVGLTRGKAGAIRHLAVAVVSGQLNLEPVGEESADLEALLALPGIGPWTAAYIALRALRDRDAIPVGDLGLRQALRCQTAAEVTTLAEGWRPWRGYAAVHLWSTFLADR
jgi:AraC family transcriptional regulator of adaptative response / DNA-3-methyladenine glycosylase II